MSDDGICGGTDWVPTMQATSLHVLSEPVATAPPFAPDPLVPVRVIDVEDVDPAAYTTGASFDIDIAGVGGAVIMPKPPRIRETPQGASERRGWELGPPGVHV